MVYVLRNSRNTTGYFYCYGVEIEVIYKVILMQDYFCCCEAKCINHHDKISNFCGFFVSEVNGAKLP